MKCRHDLMEQGNDRLRPSLFGKPFKFLEVSRQSFNVRLPLWADPTDLAYSGWLDRLICTHEFFVQLFSRAESSKGNRDFFVRNKAGQSDQMPSHLKNTNLLTHIQDKDLPAFC